MSGGYEQTQAGGEVSVSYEELSAPAEGFIIPQAERVITVFGVTGAIGSLVNLCPVEDKSSWTQSQVDSYVDRLIAMDETPAQEVEEADAKKKLTLN